MAQRRRYTQAQKVTAVLAADMTNPLAASEATGIPRRTIRQWLEKPENANLRHNAREAIAEEAMVVARLAWQALGDAIRAGLVEPRELITAAGVATDKASLLSGEATARTEHRDLSDDAIDTDALHIAEDAYSAALRGEPVHVGGRDGTGIAPDGRPPLRALPLPRVDPAGRLD
jgi:hypothetical protein